MTIVPKTSKPTAQRKPRDAATLVIVDRTGRAPRILMGRRRPDQIFLPDTFVFPGGRVEAGDRAMARRFACDPEDIDRLKIGMRGLVSDVRASALALAAIRETYEETGHLVGEPGTAKMNVGTSEVKAGTIRVKVGGAAWAPFHAQGLVPCLSRLAYFARAITPPGRPRRYDTRFFIVDAAHVARRTELSDGELLDIDWFTLDAAKSLKLPSITRHVLEDLAALLQNPPRDASWRLSSHPVPFYRHRRGVFERSLIPCALSPS